MVVVFAISCPSILQWWWWWWWSLEPTMCPSSKTKGFADLVKLAECAARTSCRKDCLTRSPKEYWTYGFSLEDTPLALQLWALWLLWMHAATCLSARVSTNKEVASAALFLATAVCWIALASFSAPTWGKSLKCLGLSFSFSVLGCCGGLVAFCGCWDGRSLFCHTTSCPMGEALSLVCKTQVLHNSVQRLEARILSWGGFWPFMNIWQKNWRCHILPSSPPSSSTTSIILKKTWSLRVLLVKFTIYRRLLQPMIASPGASYYTIAVISWPGASCPEVRGRGHQDTRKEYAETLAMPQLVKPRT